MPVPGRLALPQRGQGEHGAGSGGRDRQQPLAGHTRVGTSAPACQAERRGLHDMSVICCLHLYCVALCVCVCVCVCVCLCLFVCVVCTCLSITKYFRCSC